MTFIQRCMRPFLDIKKGEWIKVLLTCLYFYLTITSYYIIKPARNTLFINYLGANNLPYVYLVIALISYYVSALYTRFTEKFDNNKLVTISLLVIISNLLIFRWLFHFQESWFVPIVSFLFYVWVTIYSILTVTQFWVLANDVFDAQGAKRLYGLVGSGGILGGMTGGMIASYAKQLSTENLLLVSALFIGVMIILFNIIWQREKNTLCAPKEERIEVHTTKKESWDCIRSSRYIMLILILVGLIKIVTSQTEWQYNRFVEIYVGSKDDMTVLFGQIFINLNIVALVVQLVFTSNILKRFGFSHALYPLPIGLLLGSVGVLLFPQLGAASILKVSEGGLRYSINQTAKEYLFLPIPRSIRYKIKPFIDVFIYQFAKGFGALLTMGYLFVVVSVLKVSDLVQAAGISYITVLFLIAWLVTIVMLRKEYPQQVREFLSTEYGHETEVNDLAQCESYVSEASAQVNSDIKNMLFSARKRDMRIHVAVCVALHEGGKDIESIQTLLKQIIKEEEIPPQGAEEHLIPELLNRLSHERTYKRDEIIAQLSQLRAEDVRLALDGSIIEQEIDKDVSLYYKTFTILGLYESMREEAGDRDLSKDFLYMALRNILKDTIKRICMVLSLVYNHHDMRLIARGLASPTVYVRANALELFEHHVRGALRKKIIPLFDGELSIFGPERAGYYTARMRTNMVDALRDALHSGDRWLMICAMFMIAKGKVSTLTDEVTSLMQSPDALLKEAAIFIGKKIEKKGA